MELSIPCFLLRLSMNWIINVFSNWVDQKNSTQCTTTLQESMACKENSDCNEDRGYCHPKSKLCLCKNGASTYPACNGERGNDCQPECRDNQFCDLKTKICMCTLGGFTKNCNTKKCPPFRMLNGSKCECMYGTENGRCRKCRQDCGQYATCEKRG